jgi:hypothetical protein
MVRIYRYDGRGDTFSGACSPAADIAALPNLRGVSGETGGQDEWAR